MKVTRRRGILELSGKKVLKKGAATSKIQRGYAPPVIPRRFSLFCAGERQSGTRRLRVSKGGLGATSPVAGGIQKVEFGWVSAQETFLAKRQGSQDKV